MRRISLVSTCAVALAGYLVASSAQAQTPVEPAAAPTTATATISSANSNHGRGIGVGAAAMLNGISGLLVTWGNAGGGFHVDGVAGLRYHHPGPSSTTDFSLGGRFWYHIHAASFADFSVGAGIGFIRWVQNPGGGNTGANPEDSHFDVSIEFAGQIRAFIVPNVALIADLGVGATFGSNANLLIGGQSVGGAGSPEGGSQLMVGTLGIAYFFE
jgi:hypothetical protein